MRIKIVCSSYNAMNYLPKCLTSVDKQTFRDFDIFVSVDGSDDGSGEFAEAFCARKNRDAVERETSDTWTPLVYSERLCTLARQHACVEAASPEMEDVIVWLDGDDMFYDKDVLQFVADLYTTDPWLLVTYGNYEPNPPSATCPIPSPYPLPCLQKRDFRNGHKWGIRFNHLRTVRYAVYSKLDPETDFKFPNGEWFKAGGDTAVMIPCLEMAGPKYRAIQKPLVYYTSDNPLSDWRVGANNVDAAHNHIFSLPKKELLSWP